MLKLYDIVKLKDNIEKKFIKNTYLGTVVDILNNGEAYTVEFVDENGETIEDALFLEFYEDQLEKVE